MQLASTLLAALLSPSQPAQPDAVESVLSPYPASVAAAHAPLDSDDEDAYDEPYELSYTYLELGFGNVDVDDIDDDADTLYGRASLGLFDFLYFFLDYENQSTDFNDTDSDVFGLGAGGHMDVTERLNLVGEAAWLTADISSDLASLDDDDDGWTAFAGARFLALCWNRGGLELNGGYRWIDVETLNDSDISAWEAGTRVHFLRFFSVGAKYTLLEEDSEWGVDARISF